MGGIKIFVNDGKEINDGCKWIAYILKQGNNVAKGCRSSNECPKYDEIICDYQKETNVRAWTTLTAEEKVEFFKRVQNDDEVCRDISRKMKIIPNFTTWKWNPDITEFEV